MQSTKDILKQAGDKMQDINKISHVRLTNYNDFRGALLTAQNKCLKVQQATTPSRDINKSDTARYYLDNDRKSGFIIDKGELTNLFSLVSGRGYDLMIAAIQAGAWHLDCFSGFLTSFYTKFGFYIDRIEDNWTTGQPDVHYMKLIKGLRVQAC